MNHQQQFCSLLSQSLQQNTFVKLSLSNYKGKMEALKNCYLKKVIIKQEEKLSFTYRYKTNDIVKNYTITEGIALVSDFIQNNEFLNGTLFTIEYDAVFDTLKNSKTSLRKNNPTQIELQSLNHNSLKNRLIDTSNKSYLHQLHITDDKGNVIPSAQDKFKQINHYVELLSPLIKNLPKKQLLKVFDMGAGKGYLTFALYDYLTNVLSIEAQVTGIEYRKDLVTLCNSIAKSANFKGLSFSEGSIENFEIKEANMMIALHACDTATDDAIYKGIKANADLIVVAPCCHKQIRRELEKHKTKNELDVLLKHGIFMERQAEMLTDGLRALLLEYCGYTTKIFEFISGEHTPKNIMIVAEKKEKTATQKQDILNKINETKLFFGIEFHYLERLLEI